MRNTCVGVSPCGDQTLNVASDASGLTATFTVTNSTASAEVYSLDCGVFAPVSSCSVNQGSVSVPANSSALFGVTYSTGSTGGTGPLYAYATPTIHPGDTFEGYYNVVVTAPTYSVTVTVVGGPDSIEVGISATYAFRVHNGSTAAATFTLACAQSGGAICGTPAPASITLGSGQDGDVTVIGTGGTTLGAASLTLSASGPASGSAVKSVTIFRSYPLKPFSPSGNRVVRSGCPITTAGPGSAVQCGDLLYAHALPGYRSMGRPRTVTLLYSSATAKPTPVVAVDYATYPGDAPPQALRIELNNITNGSVRIAQVYFSTSGFTFSAKQTHRLTIPINADSLQLGTGAYPLQISVFKKLGGVWQDQSPDTATTRLLVVNRRASAFGAGWWEAGVERIVPDATGALLVLADGSATYFPRNGTLYQSPPGEYSTLSTTANGYKRVLKGNRVTVWYGSSGLPDSITDNNPARNRAVYAWSGERLVSITDPVGKTISFLVDASARINRIKIPGSDTVRLQQSVHSGATDADLDQITDPDGLGSPFSYAGTTHRMSASTARATGQVTYAFEALTGTVDTVSAPSGSNVPSKRFRAWQRVGVPASGTGLSEATPATPSYADSARAVLSWARYTGYLPGMPQYEQDTAWFAMDRTGAPTKVARPLVGLVTIDRDSTGLPVHITTAGGAEVWQSWNASGSLLKSKMKVRAGWTTTAVRYDSTRYVYNTAWQELDSIIPPAGDTVTFKYDASGRRDSVIDALGNVTRFYYKNNGLVWKVAAPHPTVAGGEEPLPTVFLYDSTLTWNLLSASKGTDTTRYRYDSTRVIADTVLNALGDFTAYEYDKMGRVTKQTQVALSLTSGVNGYQRLQPPNQIVSYSFNDAARLVTQTDPLGWQSTWLHDPAGRLVRRCVRESWCDSTTYQDGMNPTKQLSRRGDWTDVAFDAGGRPIAKVLTEFSPTQRDDSVSYVYDTDGILTQVRNQYSRIFFRYDPYGRRRSEAQLIRNWADTTFASGLTFYHEYDPNGRRAKTYLNGNVQCSPCANPATDSVLVAYQQPLTFTYFGNGNLKEINNPFWPVSPQKWSYSYDRKSRARGLAYPTTTPNVYNDSLAYDDNDRVAWHSFGSSSAEGTETILPDQIGRTLTRQSGQTVSYAYDGRGELILNSSSGAIAADSFFYDVLGNRKNAAGWAYTYDTDNSTGNREQLVKRQLGACSMNYYYDTDGNQVNAAWVDSLACYNQVSTRGEQARSSRYDAAGQLVVDTLRRAKTEGGQPVFVREPRSYWYDGLGRRILMKSDDSFLPAGAWGVVRYFWIDDQVVVKTYNDLPGSQAGPDLSKPGITVASGTSNLNEWFFYGGRGVDDVIASLKTGFTNPNRLFYHDYRGSVTWMTNELGQNIQTATDTYTPFGAAPNAPSGATNQPGFNGQEASGGLVYMRNRWYDPNTGKFTQQDPIGFAGGINLYGYSGNDPVNYSDPFGLCPPQWLCQLANFSAGFGDALSFGLTNLVRNAIDANGVIDKGSAAYIGGAVSGVATGAMLGGAVARVAAAAGEAAGGAAEFSSGAMQAMEKQFASAGRESVEKTIRSLTDRIAEHEVRITEAAAQGGKTSSMEREIKAWRETIRAARQLLERKP